MDTAAPQSSSSAISSHFSPLQPAKFSALLGRAGTPLILDVRREAKFAASDRIVCGAVRVQPENVEAFARQHPPHEALVYCVYGHNVSNDAAAALRAAGWKASILAGGIEGGEEGVDAPQAIAQWRAQAVPTIAKRPDLGVTGDAASRWITRAQPKIDRIACPWLIRRFIDPRAEIFYVPTTEVFTEAERLNAVAYDIPGAPISHTGERGELCSFDALLAAFDLHHAALDMLARIVRGADTDRLELAAQSAGLLALSLGLSRLHADDDQAMLAAAMPMYDALYAWCCDKALAQDEAHSWKPL